MRVNQIMARVAAVATAGAAVLLFSSAANALTYSYSTSGAPTQYSLGNQVSYGPSPYDELAIPGMSGLLTPGDTFTLNELTFSVGINATVLAPVNSYSFTENFTLGSGPGAESLTIPFNVNIGYSDDLTIGSAAFGPFADGWSLLLNAVDTGLVGTGNSETFALTGTIVGDLSDVTPTPLPAGLPLFVSGLGALALFGWYSRKKNGAASLDAA